MIDSERLELALVNGLERERLLRELECTVCGSTNDVTPAIPGVSQYCNECWDLLRDCCKEDDDEVC